MMHPAASSHDFAERISVWSLITVLTLLLNQALLQSFDASSRGTVASHLNNARTVGSFRKSW